MPNAQLYIWILLLAGIVPLTGQIRFKTKVPRMRVAEQEIFQITFVLENARGIDFEGPEFEDFTVLSKPSRVIRQPGSEAPGENIFSYSLLSKRTGAFRIPPAQITVNGKRLTSNAMQIEVLKAGTPVKTELQAQEAFVKMEVDTDELYLGQQLVLNYKLYASVNVETYYFTSEPAYHGF